MIKDLIKVKNKLISQLHRMTDVDSGFCENRNNQVILDILACIEKTEDMIQKYSNVPVHCDTEEKAGYEYFLKVLSGEEKDCIGESYFDYIYNMTKKEKLNAIEAIEEFMNFNERVVRNAFNKDNPEENYLLCPLCGKYTDNGYSRELPPSPYVCSECIDKGKNA